MVKLIKAIFLFILLILLAFLLVTTFLHGGKTNIIYNLKENIGAYQPGYYTLSGSGDIEKVDTSVDTSSLYLQKISRFASIYALENSDFAPYIIQESNSINLGKGIYVLDLMDQTKQYNIFSSGFEIQTLSSGKIYIDTRDISNITLLSLGASFKLSFLDRIDESLITSTYIFPNRYISLNTLRNDELKNADFLRVSQVVSKYGYLNENLLQSDGSIGAKLSRLVGESGQEMLTPIFTHVSGNIDDVQQAYDELYDLSIWEFPGAEYIKEKLLLFKNDTKKIVFYKNIILLHVDDLLRSDSKSTSKISEIKKNLDILAALDLQEYKFMVELIDYYGSLVFGDLTKSERVQKQNFASLLQALHGDGNNIKNYDSLLGLSDLYTKYNFYDNNSQLEDIALFNQSFFADLGVEKEDGSITNIANDDEALTDYFSAYLQSLVTQVLLSHMSSEKKLDNEILKSILSILNDNIVLGEYIYFKNTSLSRKKTGLNQNETLLILLEKFLRNNLFAQQRSSNNLLIPKNNLGVRENLMELNANTTSMFDLYDTYKSNIGETSAKPNTYSLVKDRLYEYFLAIRNYDRYIQEFDSVVKNISDTDIFLGESGEGISPETFLKYISNFSGVNISDTKVEVIEGEYYRVTKLSVNGSRMDFELYPLQGNRIESITIDFKSINGSYNLDERELDLEEKFKTARGTDKDKYDFKRFFLNTFFGQQVQNNVIFEDNSSGLTESKIIIAFKKDKLLGNGKEFSFVETHLPLKWEQVIVTQTQNSYDIEISNALYISQNTRTQYHAQFNSKYIFTNTSHKFEDITVKLYDKYTQNKGDKFMLNGTNVSFIGPVHISAFNDVSAEFFAGLASLLAVYNTTVSELGVGGIQLLYYPLSDHTKLDFVYKGDDISITVSGDDILFIKKDGKTVANSFKTSTLADVLKTLQ